MSTSLSQAAMWLVKQGAQQVVGEGEPRYWLYGEHQIPRDEYHRIVILILGDFSIAARKVIAKNFESQAKENGFRLLKVQPVGDKVQFLDGTGYLFTGYVASDVWAKTANQLSYALNGALVTFDSQPVSLVEAASLDAIWVAKEEIQEAADVTVKHGLDINYWPVIGAGIAIVSGGFLLYALLSKMFKGARA